MNDDFKHRLLSHLDGISQSLARIADALHTKDGAHTIGEAVEEAAMCIREIDDVRIANELAELRRSVVAQKPSVKKAGAKCR